MINDTTYATNAPWVTRTIAPPSKTGLTWRLTKVERLTAAENAGRQNVFIELKIAGQIIYSGVMIRYGWDGQTNDQKVQPKQLDKRPPDPSTDLVIGKHMHLWFEVVDPSGNGSDRASNFHDEAPDGTQGGEWGHGSYRVVMELLPDAITIISPPVIDNPPTIPITGTWQEAFAELAHRVKLIEDVINAKG